MKQAIKDWLIRWQEYISWTPLMILLSLAGWLVFGAMARNDNFNDILAAMLELPIRCAYAVAALGIIYFARRRQRRRLTPEQQDDLWARTIAGEKGALIVYLTDTFVWLVSSIMLLLFFWPAR